jgi:hypothetical protein
MKFQAKGNSDFKIPPAGNHVAICNMIVDMGMQPGSGQYPDPKPQVHIRFELCNELHEYEDKAGHKVTAPMVIGRTFTASMSVKGHLRKFIEGMYGKPFPNDEAAADFDFSKIAGKKCLLNVVHVERPPKTYANIQSATPLPKGMVDSTEQYNKTIYFSLDDPDKEAFNRIPNWLKEKIENRLAEAGSTTQPDAPAAGETEKFDDEVPF